MVDMGSLVSFPEIIKEKTGIDVRVIEMVSTPLVIEATRKSFIPDMNLDMLLDDLERMRNRTEYKKDASAKAVESKFWIAQLEEILSRTLTFLNPHKASEILIHVLEAILFDLDKNIDDDIEIKFLFHSSCMIERVIKNNTLDYSNLNIIKKEKGYYFNVVKDNIKIIEESFDIIIPDTEIAYIVEIIDTHYITH
jgi:transcriptional regulatory protein LevR